jgi:uncharacterized protein YbbK (DUF523 family)
MADIVLVSSCLLGLATRYDATDNVSPEVLDYLKNHQLIPIPVCPEQLAGLPTPRPKCWFTHGAGEEVLAGNGALCDEQGRDVGAQFLRGAEQTLKLAQLSGCRQAILKQRSPSCGSAKVHRNGQLVSGLGVTAALLKRHGITLLSEEDLA